MLTELIDFSHKMNEAMKASHSKIKQNIQGTNSEGREIGTQINNLEQREGKIIQLDWMKKQEFKKKDEEMLKNLCVNFQHFDIQIIGVPRGEEEDKEIENLFEKVMKENFITFFNFNFLLLFNYSCVPFLSIPQPHLSQNPLPPTAPPNPLILSMCLL